MTSDEATIDRVEQFHADVLEGPAALERLLDAGRALDAPLRGMRTPRIAFAGLGSSRYAALIVASALRSVGATAWVDDASAVPGAAPAADLILITISASGRTAEVIDAAERHHGRSLVIAVTNAPDSRLAAVADIVVPLQAGIETAGIACRTYRATIAALALLTGTPLDDLRPAVSALDERIAARDRWLPDLVEALDGASSIDVLADASLVGLAEQAALMLREAPRLPAHAFSTGDWLHTGVYLALPGHRALIYPGAAADDEVVATVDRRAGRAVTVESAPGSAVVRALVDSVVAELVAAELWRRTTEAGAPG